MKKWLKIWLTVWWSILVAWWAWAGLTKTWIIPNRFDIELLCSWKSCIDCQWILFNKWQFPQIEWKECCKDTYEIFDYYECLNNIETLDIEPLYIEWYNEENYDNWCEMKYWEYCHYEKGTLCNNTDCDEIKIFHDKSIYIDWKHENLSAKFYHDERIKSKFSDSERIKIKEHSSKLTEYSYKIEECEKKKIQSSIKKTISHYDSKKPIIYLYPTSETEIDVKLWNPQNLLHTYPKYNLKKWRNVVAQPNGDLEDIDTWRKLYALYWEWKSNIATNFDEWFVVAWKDIIPFLEEKLTLLWLNEREAEEFIIYWLPQMENNKYNLIRFETIEEQNKNMPLNITPTPDTVIRVMMDWQAIDEAIEIPEQKLITPERNWFTVVEWWWSPRN